MEKLWFTLVLNRKTICQHIECRWQVFLPQYAELSARTSYAVIWKTEDFFRIFYCTTEMCMKFRTFSKKEWVSSTNYFRNYCFRNRLLLKRLKGLASENHSVLNVLRGSKHRWKIQGITNTLLSHEFQVNGVGKSLVYSDHKSWDCLLTHWLPMASFPAAICRIFCNNFKRYYLKNGKKFLDFLLHF